MSFASAFPRFRTDLRRSSRHRAATGALAAAALMLTLVPPSLRAQSPGDIDPLPVPVAVNLTAFTVGLQLNSSGGQELFVGGDTRFIGRYTLDGLVDNAFALPLTFGGTNFTAYTQAFESTVGATPVGTSDSRVYIGGLFGQYLATDIQKNILRFNTDGSVDLNFNPGNGANGEVTAILPITDGTGVAHIGDPVLVGGTFTRFAAQDHNYLVKLNTDGSVDTTYNPALTVGDNVFSLARQLDPATGLPNGQVLVAGSFNRINKDIPAKLARLNSDGSTDTTFIPDFGTRVLTVTVQPDGKILAGGSFDSVNGLPAANIIRLNPDGSIDPTFAAALTGNINPENTPPTAVNTILLAPDGRIYAAGSFTKANGVARQNLARFNSDGSLDTSFDPGILLQNRVQSIVLQSNNNLLIAETRINRATDTSSYPNVLVRVLGGPLLTTVGTAASAETVSATEMVGTARKGSDLSGTGRTNGQIMISRSSASSKALKVHFALAPLPKKYGKDFRLYDHSTGNELTNLATGKGAIKIRAGSDHALIDVVPKAKSAQGVPVVGATVILSGHGSYGVGTPASATVEVLPPAQ